jgi:hypothetical protein
MKLAGVLIDPFAKTVARVEVEDNLRAWYELLRCDLINVVRLTPYVDLWIDGDGTFKEPPDQAYFYIAGEFGPIAGKALLLGHGGAGKSLA